MGKTQKQTPSVLTRILLLAALLFAIWTGLWFWGKHLASEHIKTVLVDPTQFDEAITIDGYPFGFNIHFDHYNIDATHLAGQRVLLSGDKVKVKWHITHAFKVRSKVYGQHNLSHGGDQFQLIGETGENIVDVKFGFVGLVGIDLSLEDATLKDLTARLLTEDITARGANVLLRLSGKGNADLNFNAEWDTITIPPLSQDMAFLGQDIASGQIDGTITQFMTANQMPGDFGCNLNSVGGDILLNKVHFDWGVLKPRLSTTLNADTGGFSGLINVMFRDTRTLFDTIAPLVPQTDSLGFEAARLGLEAAEENNTPFPVQVQNGQIRILTQGVAQLISCPN